MIDLDAIYDPNSEEEGDDALARELKKKIRRPEPDGDLADIQLGDDPTRRFKLGTNLPEHVR